MLRTLKFIFYRFTSTGINTHSSILHNAMKGKFDDNQGEIAGTSIVIDRTSGQSILDGITSIIYYMLKFNALAVVKEGLHGDDTVVCLNQLRVYHPRSIKSLGISDNLVLSLSQHSNINYDDWNNRFNSIFSIDTIHPIYAFSNGSSFGYRLVKILSLFRGVNTGVIKLT